MSFLPRSSVFVLVASVSCLSITCGGSVRSGEPTDGGPPGQAPTSLSGTWDVITGAHGETPITGVIVLGPDRLEVTFGQGSLTFAATTSGPASLTWVERGIVEPLRYARAPAGGVDLGILPLALDGHLDIGDPARPDASCTGDLAEGSMSAGCIGTHTSRLRDLPSLDDRIVGTRTSRLSSAFGALGGTWTFDNGSGSHCEATFSGTTVTLVLSWKGKDEGTMTVVFSDGLVTGVTDRGAEFTARRR